tara:strand:- start:373 stop:591 length:219 start_codon:yes stop_codon:yes gene_type:complete
MSDFDNTAALWKRQPRDNDVAGKKYPAYQGNITVNGKKMNLAAWLNTEKTKEGQPDISLKISEIVPKQEQPF